MEVSDDSYFSIEKESVGLYREKASKFIACAFPVNTEQEVKTVLEGLRKQYYDANHHCFAYRIGYEQPAYRISDDGEPSGSAGKPIYGQILSKNLFDIMVVVIRYFGGTKLGIPGLIHAYRSATAEALHNAVVVEKIISSEYKLRFDYPMMNEVMRIIKEPGIKITEQGGDTMVDLTIKIRKSMCQLLEIKVARLKGISLVRMR